MSLEEFEERFSKQKYCFWLQHLTFSVWKKRRSEVHRQNQNPTIHTEEVCVRSVRISTFVFVVFSCFRITFMLCHNVGGKMVFFVRNI